MENAPTPPGPASAAHPMEPTPQTRAKLPAPRRQWAATPARAHAPATPAPSLNACGRCHTSVALFPFTMAFQPVIDLDTQRIDAYEALVRGVNGEGAGAVLAQVDDASLYAFDQACRVKAIEQASALGLAAIDPDCRLNINFLPNAVYQPAACIRRTLAAAARTGFPRDRITFEIVEQEDVASTDHLNGIIAEYRSHGFKIALDDFSTGYSGLSRLAELKPDIVKLDRVLISNCADDRTRLAIIANMLNLCREIGVKAVLEGVETLAEVEALRAVGGRYMQGFYFARPALQPVLYAEAIRWPPPPGPRATLRAAAE
jgi:EAL domain-containing protein (putative c-di-GMP-specific phosphodiesterase class I)